MTLRSNALGGKILTKQDLRRSPSRMYSNFTDFFNSLLLPDIPAGRVHVHQLSIIGRRGSGKSWLIRHIYGLCLKRYPEDLINVIHTDDHDVAVDKVNDKPVQLVVLDDAAGAAASRMAGKNVQKVQDYNMLRHTLEDRQKEAGNVYNGGIIITIIAWQRKNDLERAMREAEFQVWKSPPVEAEDRKALEDLIGSHNLRKLQDITRKMMLGDQSAKGSCIGMISAFDREGCGIYRSAAGEPVKLPKIITGEEWRREKLKAADAGAHDSGDGDVDAAAANGSAAVAAAKRYTPADVLHMHEALSMSLQDIADTVGKSKSTVHRWLLKALMGAPEGE